MDFGVMFLSSADEAGAGGKYDLLLNVARFADAHGFSCVWTPERHFHAFGGLFPEPSVTSAAIAAVTSRTGIRARQPDLAAASHHPHRRRMVGRRQPPRRTRRHLVRLRLECQRLSVLSGTLRTPPDHDVRVNRSRAPPVAPRADRRNQQLWQTGSSLEQLAAMGGGAISGGHKIEGQAIPPDMIEDLLELTFNRYFTSGSLMGTVESCEPTVNRLIEIGVDEVVCLVDFGAGDTNGILRSLEVVDRLRAAFTEDCAHPPEDTLRQFAQPLD
jgi:alkanesulfonate monooxygenase SsuD/methylene tetrahydromethanopterin reductase-like flavin-dependent oxidoreductase (luciferase family)